MASAEKLPSGRWRGLYQDANGKKQRVPGTYERKTDAVDAAVEWQAKAKRQAAAKSGALSARTEWGDWWEIFNSERVFDSDTGATEKGIVNKHLMPSWGGEPLNKIERGHIQKWVDKLAKQYEASYVHRIYAVFRGSITGAVAEEVLTASPCVGIVLPKVKKKPKQFVSVDDAQTIGRALRKDIRDVVEFGLETGLRPGEIAGLHAHRISLTGWVLVAETFVHRSRRIRPYPKDGDTRAIPLSAKALSIVKQRLAGRDLTKGCGLPHTDGEECRSALVFLAEGDRVVNRDLITEHMGRAAKAMRVAPKTGYALRRGFATRLAEGGLDPFELMRMMGHESLEQTNDYVQQTERARAKVLAALGEQPALRPVGPRGTGRGNNLALEAPGSADSQAAGNTA